MIILRPDDKIADRLGHHAVSTCCSSLGRRGNKKLGWSKQVSGSSTTLNSWARGFRIALMLPAKTKR